MEWTLMIISIIGFFLALIGISTSTENESLSGICFIISITFIACALLIGDKTRHNENCTCEKCTPIAVKEYCPCGCGQYEIVYKYR